MDELLEWTTSLNYEDYVTSWKQMGTSSQSESIADKRRFLTAELAENIGVTNEVPSPSPRAHTNTAQDHKIPSELERIPT